MFIQKRLIQGKTYNYLEHSYRLGNTIRKASFILTKDQENNHDRIIDEIAQVRAQYFLQDFPPYFTQEEMKDIEKERVFFQIFHGLLDEKSQQEIMNQFIQLFLANSMELEGSTITPQLAERIEKKKKTSLPEADLNLYTQSKQAVMKALHFPLRSTLALKNLHKEIYQGVYPHAGQLKTQTNTFGYIEKAQTLPPSETKKEIQKLILKKREGYPFLRPLLFHLEYQKIHPFFDGNSRLGRILLVTQMYKMHYPPLIFKGDLSFQIRETIVEYCNKGHLDFCRLAKEQYLLTAKKFWRPMIKKFLWL